MSKLNQRTELVANILIIVVAIALSAVLIQKYFFSAKVVNQQARVNPTIGSKLNVPDLNFWSTENLGSSFANRVSFLQ